MILQKANCRSISISKQLKNRSQSAFDELQSVIISAFVWRWSCSCN